MRILLFIVLLFQPVIWFGQNNGKNVFETHRNTDRSVDTLRLVFEDNFDGTQIDDSKWRVIEGVVRDTKGSHEKQWYSPKNIYVSEGTLKVEARRESLQNMRYEIWEKDRMVPYTDSFEYSSGEIDSREQFGFGVYEIRCKIPRGKGFWPAFWMYGEKDGINNEIDVFEFWNQRGIFTKLSKNKLARVHNMTAHYKGRMSQKNYVGPEFSEDFHVFRVVWDECRIEWWMDGSFKRRITRYKKMRPYDIDCGDLKSQNDLEENVFPRDSVMGIIANLAIQSKDAAPDDSTPFPAIMEIDYIRYFEWAGRSTK